MRDDAESGAASGSTGPGAAGVRIELDALSHWFTRAGGGRGRGRRSRVERSLHVLDDVSLVIEPGELVAVIGPSGGGKSTLLRLIAGLLSPTAGEIRADGRPLGGRTDLVAYQPQRDLLLPWRRVLGNVTLAAAAAGVDRDRRRADALAQLDRFGLAEFVHAWPAELSGGMRQRVALLRAHLSPRPVVLLDEPLGSLDALTRSDLQTWLGGLHTERPRTTLLVTHDVEEALLLADRVVVLSARPARIVHTLTTDWPRPRDPALVLSAELQAARAELLAALGRGAVPEN